MADDWIETLAFGETNPRISSCLGLYLSPEVMFLSEVHASNGKPVVDQVVKIPLAQNPAPGERTTGALNADLLSNPIKLVEALSAVMRGKEWRSSHIIVTLSQNFGLLRYFTMPGIDRRYWSTAVPAEAKKHVPLSFADLVHDFQVRPFQAAEKKTRLGVLFMVTYRANLFGIRMLAEKLEKTILGVEIAPCSVERFWDSLAAKPAAQNSYVQVHFEGGEARVLVAQEGWPILFREIHFGSEPKVGDSRKLDLSGCIDFSKKQLALQTLSEVRISGAAPELDGWKEVFSQETGLSAVVVNDRFKAAGLKVHDWGAHASIGSALHYLVPTQLKSDLAQARRISSTDRRAAKAIFALAGVLAGWFLLLAATRYVKLFFQNRQYSAIQQQQVGLEDFRNKKPEQIQKLVDDLQGRVRSFGAFAMSDLKLTYVLEDIADSVPDALWLNQITYSNAIGTDNSIDGSLILRGNVRAASVGDEQDLAVQFRERLQNNKRFSSLFACSAPSVQVGNSGAAQGSSAWTGGANMERTTFTIDCHIKKT